MNWLFEQDRSIYELWQNRDFKTLHQSGVPLDDAQQAMIAVKQYELSGLNTYLDSIELSAGIPSDLVTAYVTIEKYMQDSDVDLAANTLNTWLLEARKQNKPDLEVLVWWGLSRIALRQSNAEQAKEQIRSAMSQLKTVEEDRRLFFKSLLLIQEGRIWVHLKNYDQLLDVAKQLTRSVLVSAYPESEIYGLNYQGISYGAKGNYKLAAPNLLDALEKGQRLGFDRLNLTCSINLATIYANLKDYTEAESRYFSIMNDYTQLLDDNLKLVIINNLGNLNLRLGKHEQSKDFFEQALILARTYDKKQFIALGSAQLAICLARLGQIQDARQYAEQATVIFEGLESPAGIQKLYFAQALLAQADQQELESIEIAAQARTTAETYNDDLTVQESLKLLSQLYEALGQYKESLKTFQQYADMQIKEARSQEQLRILEQEIHYLLRDKQRISTELETENRFKKVILQKSEELKIKNIELERKNDELKSFARVVSHDLREPVRTMASFSQLVQRELKDHESDRVQEFLGYIGSGAKKVNALVDSLLQYALINYNQYPLDTFKVNELVSQALLMLKTEGIVSDLTIETAGDLPEITAARPLLLKVFKHLLKNAAQFYQGNDIPTVKITAKEASGYWVFRLEDNGPGLPEKYLETVFTVFQKTRLYPELEGSGIGLASCRKIIDQAGGRIWLESNEEKGLTIYFSLPIEDTAQ